MLDTFRTIKISQKIPVAIGIFVIIPIILSIIALRSASTINSGGQEIYDNYFVSVVNLTDARKYTYEEFIWLKSHIISPDDASMNLAERNIERASAALKVSMNKFADTLDAGEETQLFNQVQNKLKEMETLRKQIITLSQTNDDVKADQMANNQYRQLFETVHRQMDGMFKTNVDGAEQFYANNQQTYDSSWGLIVFVAILAVIIGILVGWVLISSILVPLLTTKSLITNINTSKDLTKSLPTTGNDEITQMSQAFNEMMASVKQIIAEISAALAVLQSESENLLTAVDCSNNNLTQSSDTLNNVQNSSNEITIATDEIAQNADLARGEAENSGAEAQKGLQLQQQNMMAVEGLRSNMFGASEAITELSRNTNEIGSVLDVIRGIAEQTNLLALNAAIEAARAGEQGRGFAVVADEVRNLAQRTQESTMEIQQMIEKLQSGAEQSVSAMQESLTSLDKTSELSAESEQALKAITNLLNNILGMNDQIASATEEQSLTLKAISGQVNQANEFSKSSTESFTSLRSSSHQLNEVVAKFEGLIQKFKF